MKFHEHIIRVTVPGLPCEVTREELSGELADFAHRPEHFLEEVTKSEVVSPERRGSEPGSIAFERNIYFGHLVFHETVQIGADGSYRSHAAGSGERPASDFSMQIEEPEPGQLFIRFIYFEDRPEVPTAIEMNSREQQVDYLRRLLMRAKTRALWRRCLPILLSAKWRLRTDYC